MGISGVGVPDNHEEVLLDDRHRAGVRQTRRGTAPVIPAVSLVPVAVPPPGAGQTSCTLPQALVSRRRTPDTVATRWRRSGDRSRVAGLERGGRCACW